MFATFNMGIGMILVVPPDATDEVGGRAGHDARRIGVVEAGPGLRIA
jgi:phosphoribosylaminoimidazole (AIR) synthetase